MSVESHETAPSDAGGSGLGWTGRVGPSGVEVGLPTTRPARSAYGATAPAEDARLTHVGPGTPAGELLRRYWQPVALSDELGDLPRRVRVLGEDLVLIRDGAGRVGALDLHCPHRGTSLEYGRIEAGGIRCCYHGWLMDTAGRVCHMLCEPPGTAERLGIVQPGYPVREVGGLVFAYLGPPEREPTFPLLDVADRPDVALQGRRLWGEYGIGYVRDCNWLQHLENVVDPWHLIALHTQISGAQFGGVMGQADLPAIEMETTPVGVRYMVHRPIANGNVLRRCTEIVFPNIALIPSIHETGEVAKERDVPTDVTWVVPIDDTHVTALTMLVVPVVDGAPDPAFRPGTDTETRDADGNLLPPGFRPERPYEERQRFPDDMEAQESQRPIAVHALEHLVSSDRGVLLYRRQLRAQIARVEAGEDPLNVARGAGADRRVRTNAYNRVTAGQGATAPS
jgi:nitrite reductase/ring-hydroxylating ferredoxin subunit